MCYSDPKSQEEPCSNEHPEIYTDALEDDTKDPGYCQCCTSLVSLSNMLTL